MKLFYGTYLVFAVLSGIGWGIASDADLKERCYRGVIVNGVLACATKPAKD